MSNTEAHQVKVDANHAEAVFADPVTYLAMLGISCELVSARELPLAA